MTIPRILAIAGSDSGGGAGIQADIKTITMLGGHAMTAVTAVTAQNTTGVTQVMAMPAELVRAQIDAVVSDIGVDAVKIGMIGSPEIAEIVSAMAASLPVIVFDPVMIATSGARLADRAAIATFSQLMDRAALITPNVPELAVLTGRAIDTAAELEAAARVLAQRHDSAVLAKGGHLPDAAVTDILIMPDGGQVQWVDARIGTRHDHGTGCTLSSGIAFGLARGMALADAIAQARAFVRAALAAAPGLGHGHGPMGHGLGKSYFRG